MKIKRQGDEKVIYFDRMDRLLRDNVPEDNLFFSGPDYFLKYGEDPNILFPLKRTIILYSNYFIIYHDENDYLLDEDSIKESQQIFIVFHPDHFEFIGENKNICGENVKMFENLSVLVYPEKLDINLKTRGLAKEEDRVKVEDWINKNLKIKLV